MTLLCAETVDSAYVKTGFREARGRVQTGTTVREEGRDLSPLDALLLREYPRIRRLAKAFGLPEQEIDDAVQEVFARAWAARGRFQGDSAVSTWLTRIAVNHFCSRRQALFRRLRTFLAGHDADALERVPAKAGLPSEVSEAHEHVMACVHRLSVKLRQVFVLRYVEELEHAEIAKVLGISEHTTRSRAFNARRAVREMMEEFER